MFRSLKNIYSKTSLFIWSHRKLFISLIVLGFVADLYARAGGGHNYRSSSSSHSSSRGSSSSSGSGDIGNLLFFIYLLIRYPVIGIPVAIFVVIYLVYKAKSSVAEANIRGTIGKRRVVQNNMLVEKIVLSLKAKDAGFNTGVLMARFKSAFVSIQKSWSAQDLSAVKNFISDGIYERFSLQFREQKDRKYVNKVENVKIMECRPAFLVTDKVYETLTVKITASAVDYNESLETGRVISGDSSFSSTFTEYWSFIRKVGTKSINEKGLIEGFCPNCGTPLTLNSNVKCESCGSLIKSGQFDWVLSEITQAGEWNPGVQASAPGVDDMQLADPDFSKQNVEDRVSVIFWRYLETLRTGSVDPVRKMATEKFCASDAVKVEKSSSGDMIIPADCAVGSVDTLGILMKDDVDTAFVEVKWAGAKQLKSKLKTVRAASLYKDVFVLIRKHGVTVAKTSALSSAHCPSCGAPVSDDASDACLYCGAVLNTGSHDWVLDRIAKPYDDDVKALLTQLKPDSASHGGGKAPETGFEMVSWMIFAMLADGVIDKKEEKLIYDYAVGSRLGYIRTKRLVELAKQGKLEVAEPKNPKEGEEWLKAMIYMAYADGNISKSELKAISMLGDKIGMEKKDILKLVNDIKQEIYLDSKAFLKKYKK